MIKIKQILCATIMCSTGLGYGAALPRRNMQGPFLDLQGAPNASVQRTMDGYIKVAKSDQQQERAKACYQAIGRLLAEHGKQFNQAFLAEIKPEDAEQLLPLIDALNDLFVTGADAAQKMSTSTLSRDEEAQLNFAISLKFQLLVALAVPYIKAMEKHKNLTEAKGKEALVQAADMLKNVTDFFVDMRNDVAKKAQS